MRFYAALRDFGAGLSTLLWLSQAGMRIISGGSTTRAFAGELGVRRGLTVVTNNLAVPPVLDAEAVRELYLLGGAYRAEAQVTVGEVRFGRVAGISADAAVIGVGGITAR